MNTLLTIPTGLTVMSDQLAPYAALTVEPTVEGCSPQRLIREYLVKHEPVFARLLELQQKVFLLTPCG